MKREIDMKEISDGKLYGPNDLVVIATAALTVVREWGSLFSWIRWIFTD